jgi:hypothetical protein
MSFYDPVADFYSKPQVGSGISIFQGGRRQAGGGIFASIQRFAVPILRRIGQKLLNIAPTVGSKALEVVKETVADVKRGKRFGEAAKINISAKIRKTLQEQGLIPAQRDEDEQQQKGSGLRRKKNSSKKKKTTSKRINKGKKKRKSSFRDIFASSR